MDILSCTPSQWNEKESQYLELLQNHEIWEQVRKTSLKWYFLISTF